MDPSVAKPRVNGSMLSNCIGQHVCLVGKNLGVSRSSEIFEELFLITGVLLRSPTMACPYLLKQVMDRK